MARVYIAVTDEMTFLQKGWDLLFELSRRQHDTWITTKTGVFHDWLTASVQQGGLVFAQPKLIVIFSSSPQVWLEQTQNHSFPCLVLCPQGVMPPSSQVLLPIETDTTTVVSVIEGILQSVVV